MVRAYSLVSDPELTSTATVCSSSAPRRPQALFAGLHRERISTSIASTFPAALSYESGQTRGLRVFWELSRLDALSRTCSEDISSHSLVFLILAAFN
jgi:hypothetical protein